MNMLSNNQNILILSPTLMQLEKQIGEAIAGPTADFTGGNQVNIMRAKTDDF